MMPDRIELSTPDPRFDPTQPVMVNGYLYLPAQRSSVQVGRPGPKTVVEVQRRKMVERT